MEVVDPWALTTPIEVAEHQAADRHAELNALIGARNAEAIRSCSRLVAVLDGQEPDAGTCAEIGYAAGLGLRIDALRTDWRQAGEVGATVNLQVQYFVEASGGRIVGSLDDARGSCCAGPERPRPALCGARAGRQWRGQDSNL